MPKPGDKDILEDFPEDGDELKIGAPGLVEPQDDPPDPPEDPIKALERTIADQNARIEALTRQIPPPQPKATPELKAEEEPDWDNLLFTKPKEALRLHGERVAKEVEARLTATYQRDQGTRKFWDTFYDKHKDLKDDHDLVELTLNSNLATLANIPVAEAMKKLSDLTRERIIRYAGGVKPKGKKAMVEGSGLPAPKRTPVQTAEISTLSDIIKSRKDKRRRVVAA